MSFRRASQGSECSSQPLTPRNSTQGFSLRNGAGVVDAPGRRAVGAQGEYPHRPRQPTRFIGPLLPSPPARPLCRVPGRAAPTLKSPRGRSRSAARGAGGGRLPRERNGPAAVSGLRLCAGARELRRGRRVGGFPRRRLAIEASRRYRSPSSAEPARSARRRGARRARRATGSGADPGAGLPPAPADQAGTTRSRRRARALPRRRAAAACPPAAQPTSHDSTDARRG